jgi:hypothetical protein
MAEPLLEMDDQELELDRQSHPEVTHTSNTNRESQPPSLPTHTNSQSERNPSDSQGQRQDLFHTFQLFKTYSDHKFVDFKSDILSEQQTPTKQFGNNPILNLNPRETVSSLDSTKRLWTVFTSYIITSPDKFAYITIDLITKLIRVI